MMGFELLLVAALIVLAVWAVNRGLLGTDRGRAPHETPQEILDRRFAAGEIDAQAYRQARAQLAEARDQGTSVA